jgi:purine-binding chemotaxis protein CheW
MRLLTFALDGQRYAVTANAVVEIVRAVAVTPLPGAPGVIAGVIDVRGAIVPVFDLRVRFGVPRRATAVADQFILVRTPARTAALHVDQALDLVEADDASVSDPRRQATGAPHIAGVATLPDGLVLIHDVAAFLSMAEAETLDAAMEQRGSAASER